MRDWTKIKADAVFNGKDENGVRYLPEFLQDYQTTFNAVPEGGCHKCLIRYYTQITKYLSKMNTKTKSSFKLKQMFEGIQFGFGSNRIISNRNLTDEIAVELLDTHPHGKKLFEIVPNNLDEIRQSIEGQEPEGGSEGESLEKQLKGMSREDLDAIAPDFGIEPKDHKRKGNLIAAIVAAAEEGSEDSSEEE